ncbi:two-component sensor histidine kinase [Bacteroidaceae bacterium HV4-6-C5C]|nr:two-component sensor histidine kinase [Bacteroidaceae bacterium HV4-6-C5C]
MDIASKQNKPPHLLPFSRKLFLSVIMLFLVFAGCFLTYQYGCEKRYKIELLDLQLENCNERLFQHLEPASPQKWHDKITAFLKSNGNKDLRITIIDLKGNVLLDSYENHKLKNHANRPEVRLAMQKGHGYDVRRTSESTGLTYFYSASKYNNYLIRSALPYNPGLIKHFEADRHYLWFSIIISLLLIFIFYKFTSKLGIAIKQLREFAQKADKNEPIDIETMSVFPHNELGEISQHIIQIYKRLSETKEALYIEREKLIMHLQSSREGLGIFNKDKKEILVNNLFIQFSNLISDSNLERTEQIFSISEFEKITEFIDKSHITEGGERRNSITINKSGRIFTIECIVFQDLSFEISINNITQEEEQIRLKRQLTQNIAHELKTPVSSIQGYLETIVTNPDIPQSKIQQFLERCYAQSNRLSRLLRDISVLTRMDEAANMIDMEKVDISSIVHNIINEVSLELEEKRIKVYNLLNAGITLRGNYSLLYSIFRNLMDNAIAYAGTDIQIQISCFREDESYYYFSFADTGIGVSPEHLNRLFERFYRVDKGRSRKLGGTGLGLAIVKNAVIIHGGTISAKNNPGGGLVFIFTLAKEKK